MRFVLHTHTHTQTHTHTHTHTHAHTHTRSHTNTHIHTQKHTLTHTHARTHEHPHARTRDTRTHIHTITHPCRHTLIHTHSCTHDRTQASIHNTHAQTRRHFACTHTHFHHHLHHHHLSLNREGRWGSTDHFTTSFLHSSLFSAALWDLANSRFVHFLMLSSNLFLCLPCLLPPFTVPCKMALARRDERETCPYHYGLRLFTMVRRSSCGPVHKHVRMQIHTSPRRWHTDTHKHRHTRKHTDIHLHDHKAVNDNNNNNR